MTALTKHFLVLFLSVFTLHSLFAQGKITHMEPPNWWVGMKNPNVQLLVHGEGVGNLTPTLQYPGVKLEMAIKVKNPNYLFLDLVVDKTAKPGTVKIDFAQNGKTVESRTWELLQREAGAAERQGFNNADVLYLITPDRFANGDPNNDQVAGLQEKPNRSLAGGRHGGDIEGMRQHLDYVSDMGFTAIWLNPVLENDMQAYSYHGYSTTDFYKVDPRYGSNESYRQLAEEAKIKGVKLIMDMIVNHCGLEHWWMKDPPMDDWINFPDKYQETNHRKSVIQDPHASQLDHKIFTDGWFVPTMPDLNQRNPLMATYLTQNSIWWVEYLGLAGIRMDTYPYPDMDYMADWTKALMTEYPNFNIVGEEWHENPAIVSYWQKGKVNTNGYTSDLKSLMDFPLQAALSRALNNPDPNRCWDILYETMAQDFLYPDPMSLVVFPDNHDMSRIFTQVNEDFDLFKLAIAYTLTTRGIPQLYYGTEILMKNPGTQDHGIIRSDFPGGWAGDAIDGFNGKGLTNQQQEAKAFVKKLLTWRKSAPAVQWGKLTHFIHKDGVYVFFRYSQKQRVMVVLNRNPTAKTLELERFAEMLKGYDRGIDVLSGGKFDLKGSIELPAKAPLVLVLE
ncbi:MAG: glycoside hydrolase family 13 protein [Lewinellaceae bacterium]|nr:glycoside hydrolase family 13 protein [Saprospiraceae bacterium]MCB9338780.1 glycoside hydrolase family 13 protein [Lewinellaceae bacterium]